MSLSIFALLILAAVLHATWNALVRRDSDRDAAATAIAAGCAIIGLAVLPFGPPMAAAAIPYVIMSSFTHILYYGLVARAYRLGELSVVYPIMRGLAPLIVTVAGALVFAELISPAGFAGVALVACGIVALGAEGMRKARDGIGAALLNAMVIAGYTLIDGFGARASGAPATYTAWILIGGGIATVGWRMIFVGRVAVTPLVQRVPLGLGGGLMSYGAYAIALWAMTIAPIGMVAAVRESSVLFATAIGAIFLGERFGPIRWMAAVVVVAGLALVKLGGTG